LFDNDLWVNEATEVSLSYIPSDKFEKRYNAETSKSEVFAEEI